MTAVGQDLDALRARSDALDREDYEVAVDVYESILRLEPGDLLATRGLALALVGLEEYDRADEVVQQALTLHPSDEILLKRAEGIASARRWAARSPSKAGNSKGGGANARVTSTWLKVVYFRDGFGLHVEPGQETWFSDPGQRDPNGERMHTADGTPWGRPSWRVGEQAGVYFGGTKKVPLLMEIIAEPKFDPVLVQKAEWAQDGDGERYPWVTRMRVLRVVDLDSAPTLEQLGIATSSIQRTARIRTDPEIHARLIQALAGVV